MAWKVKYCCCCFPLRTGVLVYGYIKIISNYITLLFLMFRIHDILSLNVYFDPMNYIFLSLGFAISVINFIFDLILIAALHKRSINLLEHYNTYTTVMLIFQIAGMAFYVPLKIYISIPLMTFGVLAILLLVMVLLAFIFIGLQTYIIVSLYSLKAMMIKDGYKERIVDDLILDPGPSKMVLDELKTNESLSEEIKVVLE